MAQKESFGMMDEGYFVPRTEILDWINNLLNLSLTKIEQLGSGAVYCQIIDVIHPGKIALNKVNWKAKNDYEFISNLKILQSAFDKIGIKRYVEVQKLAKAKYQDNLEFIQWMKRYYDLNCGQRGNNYMAQEKRGSVQVDFSFAQKNVVPKSYNGSGQVIPKNEKTEILQKKKQPNTNVVSTIAAYRNQNKKQVRKQNLINNSNSKKVQGKDQKNQIKQLESKLDSIKKIAQSGETAQKKMKRIEEILNLTSDFQNNEKIEAQKMEQEQEQQII